METAFRAAVRSADAPGLRHAGAGCGGWHCGRGGFVSCGGCKRTGPRNAGRAAHCHARSVCPPGSHAMKRPALILLGMIAVAVAEYLACYCFATRETRRMLGAGDNIKWLRTELENRDEQD